MGIAVVIAGTTISMLQDANRSHAGMAATSVSDTGRPDNVPVSRAQPDAHEAIPAPQPKTNAEALSSSLERLRVDLQGRLMLQASSDAQPSAPAAAAEQMPPAPQPIGQPAPFAGGAESEWPHSTASGTRWNLKSQGGRLLLLVDLGGGRTASIEVAPAFRNLTLPEMSMRVSWLRSVIAQNYFDQPGNYLYMRNGTLYRTQ